MVAIPSFGSTIQLGTVGDAEVGINYISFGQYPVGSPYNPAPNGTGTFEVTSPVTDVFASNGVAPGEFGVISSISSTYEPVGVTLPTPVKFMTFDSGGSNLQLWLTELFPGSPSPLGASPFILTDTMTGAIASFSVGGNILDTNTGSTTPFTGVFSATFSGTNVATLITDALSNTPVATPYSASFTVTTTTPVPEPASLLLMGVGLLGAGIVARKRFNRAA